jgi:hypothetical protein
MLIKSNISFKKSPDGHTKSSSSQFQMKKSSSIRKQRSIEEKKDRSIVMVALPLPSAKYQPLS